MAKKVYPKLPDLPGWSEEALDGLDAYLAGVIEQAERASRARAYAATVSDEIGAAEHALYWRHAKGAYAWLRAQIRRSRHYRKLREDKSDGGPSDVAG